MGGRRRAGLQLRWAWRDARRRRGQVAAIAVLLALGVGMFASMSSMSAWRVASADASFAALRMHDLRVALAEGATVPQGALRDAVGRSGAGGDVADAEERLVVPTQVRAPGAGGAVVVPGRLVGAPPDGPVDALHMRGGRLPRGPEVAVEYGFADRHGLPAATDLTLSGGRRVRAVGRAVSPEYFVVTLPGAEFGAEAAFAVVFAPLATAQRLAGAPGRVNEVVLRLRPGADAAAARRALERSLPAALPGVAATVVLRDEEPAHRLIYEDARGDQRMLDVFAALLLAAAAFAALNLVGRTVEAGRREIGIGMALGVPPRALALRPMLLALEVGVAGVALGIPVGLAADAWLAGVVESFFPLPVVEAGARPAYYLRAAAVGLAVPLLAAAVPVWRAVRVPPVEAIRIGARGAARSGLAPLAARLRLPGGALGAMPLRNVLRAPRRTLMTLAGVAAVVTILVALSGLMDSFDATLEASRREALAGDPRRLTVDLDAPRRADDPAVRAVLRSPAVGAAQSSLRLAAALEGPGGSLDVALETVPASRERPVWHPTLVEGALPDRGAGLVIARRAASDIGVGTGDRVRVVHPTFRGGRTGTATTTMTVTGIHAGPLRMLAYTGPGGGAAMDVAGLVDRLSVTPAPGRTAAEAQAALMSMRQVVAVQGAAAVTDAADETLARFDDVLVVVVGIAACMALLLALEASAINADERIREHATMFAHGVPVARVVRGTVEEALVVGALGTALGIAAGRVLLRWLIEVNVSDTLPDVGVIADVAPATYALAAVAGTVAVGLAPLLTARRLRRTDVPASLRVVE